MQVDVKLHLLLFVNISVVFDQYEKVMARRYRCCPCITWSNDVSMHAMLRWNKRRHTSKCA